jgi:hypothetical protein
MPIHGDLATMTLPDLLQWASENRKTGVLELEHNNVSRRIEFRKGWITGCSSDDPPSRLGQFLLSTGKISEEDLREALSRQQDNRKNLGLILVETGLLTSKQLASEIAAKAEETIYGLFDWEEAVFRFASGTTLDPDQIEVRLSARDILMNGLQRQDELGAIRQVFSSSGIVLRPTGPAPTFAQGDEQLARKVWESVDGERTLGELLLHAHASEFRVLKLLYEFHRQGLVEIAGTRPAAQASPTILDPTDSAQPAVRQGWSAEDLLGGDDLADLDTIPPATACPPPTAGAGTGSDRSELEEEVAVASRLMSRDEHEAALELLNATYRAHPGETYLRQQIVKAERALVDAMRDDLPSSNVPIRVESDDPAAQELLSAHESYLLTLMDGTTDVRSILWLTPMREIDVFRTLRQLVARGLVRLEAAEASEPVHARQGAGRT